VVEVASSHLLLDRGGEAQSYVTRSGFTYLRSLPRQRLQCAMFSRVRPSNQLIVSHHLSEFATIARFAEAVVPGRGSSDRVRMARRIAPQSVRHVRKPPRRKPHRRTVAFGHNEVTLLRFRLLAILLTSTCIVSGVAVAASPVAVRYREGLIHGFLVLSTLDGVVIGAGDITQVARGDQVTIQLAFRFKDGSRQEETTVFSQRGNFRLIFYHLAQKGPSFKNASDLSITCATGQVTVRYTDDDGKQKVANEHLALPPDLGNGLIPTLLMNIRDGAPQIEVPMVVAAPKPRLVKIVVNAQGTEPFSLAGFSREAIHYVAKVDIGGVAGVVAPIIGKQPPDSQLWILGGEAPVLLKSETQSYMGGPMWRIELVSPVWPQASAADSKKGTATKH
jgi:hypothetical protein